jgi:hypothetical protein
LLGRARLGGETFDLPGGKVKVPLTARMRVRLHRSRVTFGVNWPLAALLVAVAGVYVLAGWRSTRTGRRRRARWRAC